MKRIISLVIVCFLVLTGCMPNNLKVEKEQPESQTSVPTAEAEPISTALPILTPSASEDLPVVEEENWENVGGETPSVIAETEEFIPVFADLGAPETLNYVEDTVYSTLISDLNSEKYIVESVQSIYISQEYLEELAFNSKSNIYFGYTLDELEEQFKGERFIFTLGEDGKTVVREFSPYDDTYDIIIRNAAIGTGVILVCVVITVVSKAAGATAFSAVFAASAKAGSIAAVADGLVSGVTTGVITNMETGNKEQALKEGALSASEGFKWGAIIGAITGGAEKAIALKGATKGGLTMNQVAKIQQESKLPLDFIKNFHSMDEYNVYKSAGLVAKKINGKWAYVQNIDWDYIGDAADGRTNAQRVMEGLSPLGPDGKAYELHHVGQKGDSPLAILTNAQHKKNHGTLHANLSESNVDHGYAWKKTVREFWQQLLKESGKGV